MPLKIVFTFGKYHHLIPEQDRSMNGITSALLGLTSTLAGRGHDVHIFADCPRPGMHSGVMIHDRERFAQYARRCDVDALVAVPEVLPLLMPLRVRARVVWSGNGYRKGDYALMIPWKWAKNIGSRGERARLYDMALMHGYADRFVGVGQWQVQRICDTLGIPDDKFAIAYNGVPLKHFQGPAPHQHRCRLVYTSKPKRGLGGLLRLFPKIRALVPEAELHIFAKKSDPDDPYFKHAMQPGVHWRGRLSKSRLAHELKSAGVMTYPCTFTETFCSSVAEAQAAGLPVVTTDLAALSERVSHAVDGFLIPGESEQPEHDAAFVDAVVRLLSEDNLWRQMSAAAEKKARHLYDWNVIAAGWEDLLEGIVVDREPQPPRIDPTLNLLDPSLLTVTAGKACGEIPARTAEQGLREAWVSYGFDRRDVPGLPPG